MEHIENIEKEFKSSQMNKLTIRTFEDGTLSFFVNNAGEEIDKAIPLTFYPALAQELKSIIFEYDAKLLDNIKKELNKVAKQLSDMTSENLSLQQKMNKYEDAKKKFEELKSIKSSIINGITNLKPNTRVYICKNGVTHNEDILVDAEDFREEIKNIIGDRL